MALTKVDKSVSSTPGIVDSSNATAITIDSSEHVGIGHTTPDFPLVVRDATTSNYLKVIGATNGNAGIAFGDDDAELDAGILFKNDTGALRFFKSGFTEAARLDSSGNFLVGTTSGSDPLVVSDSGASSITARFLNTNADANPANIRLQKNSSSPADNDYVGMINVSGDNDAGEETIFQSIDFISTDVSDGTEDGVIAFRTRGAGTLAERLRITEQGFLKLSSKVSFSGTGDAGLGHHTNNYLYIYGGSAGLIHQDNSSGSNRILIRDSNSIEFEVNGSQRAQFDSNGAFLVGTTTAKNNSNTLEKASGVPLHLIRTGDPSAFNSLLLGYGSGGSTANISIRGDGDIENTNNTYMGFSDERIKSNIVDANSQLEDIKKVKVRKYTLDLTGETHIGVIAQELEEAGMSGLVSESEETGYKSVKYSILYMKAIKAIQEQQAIIEDLQTQINEVKNGN